MLLHTAQKVVLFYAHTGQKSIHATALILCQAGQLSVVVSMAPVYKATHIWTLNKTQTAFVCVLPLKPICC